MPILYMFWGTLNKLQFGIADEMPVSIWTVASGSVSSQRNAIDLLQGGANRSTVCESRLKFTLKADV